MAEWVVTAIPTRTTSEVNVKISRRSFALLSYASVDARISRLFLPPDRRERSCDFASPFLTQDQAAPSPLPMPILLRSERPFLSGSMADEMPLVWCLLPSLTERRCASRSKPPRDPDEKGL